MFILQKEKETGDYNVLSIPDLIAADAHYHKSCYKQYLTLFGPGYFGVGKYGSREGT